MCSDACPGRSPDFSCVAPMLTVVRMEELGQVLHSFLKVPFNSVGFGWLLIYTCCRRSSVRFLSVLPAVWALFMLTNYVFHCFIS